MGQLLRRAQIDATSPVLRDLGVADGTSEHAQSAELWLLPRPAQGDDSGILPGEVVAQVAGVARRGAEEVAFTAGLPLSEAMAGGQPLSRLRMVLRIPADLPLGEPGAVELRVDPRAFLELADFADLAARPTDERGRHIAGPDDGVVRALLTGVRLSRGAYLITWAPG